MEHYGDALLAAVAVSGAMRMVYSCMEVDGMVFRMVEIFMQSICG